MGARPPWVSRRLGLFGRSRDENRSAAHLFESKFASARLASTATAGVACSAQAERRRTPDLGRTRRHQNLGDQGDGRDVAVVRSALHRLLLPADDAETTKVPWREVCVHLSPEIPEPVAPMDTGEPDRLARTRFLPAQRSTLRGTSPLKRLVGATLPEPNGDRDVQRSQAMILNGIALSDGDFLLGLPTLAA